MSGEYIKMTIQTLLQTTDWHSSMGDLHRLINIFDAKKDAFHATTTISKLDEPYDTLIDAIGKMVGDTPFLKLGSDNDLKALEDFVLPSLDKIKAGSASVSGFSTTLGEAPTPISMLKSNVQIDSPIIPEEIVNGIVDAAADPKQYNKNITIVETPSQFSDPGTRPIPGLYYPRNDTPIEIILSDYGFAPNSRFTARFNHTDNPITATIEIVLNGTVNITVTIDRNGKYQNITINDVLYDYAAIQAFAGNPTKNAFINGMDNTDGTDVLFAIVYVLCKEIGDTIQVLMLLILFRIIGGQLNSSNTLIFTPDIVFAMRCRIVGIPCLLKKMVKDSVYRSLLHYTGMANPDQQRRAINVCYKNQCIDQNNSIILLIAQLIAEKEFSLGGSKIKLTPRGKEYLQTIFAAIEAANVRIKALNETMDKTEFRLLCSENIAFNLFGKSGRGSVFKPNMSIKQLFPTTTRPMAANNVRFGDGFAYELIAHNDGRRGGSLTKKYKGGEYYPEDLHADFYDLCYPYLLFFGANYVDPDIFKYLIGYPSLQAADKTFHTHLNGNDRFVSAFSGAPVDSVDDRDIITQEVYNDIKKYITEDKYERIFNSSLRGRDLTIASVFRGRERSRDAISRQNNQFHYSSDSDAAAKSSESEGESQDETQPLLGTSKSTSRPSRSLFERFRRSFFGPSRGGSCKINKSNMITNRRNKNKYSIKTSKHQKKNKRSARKTQRRCN